MLLRATGVVLLSYGMVKRIDATAPSWPDFLWRTTPERERIGIFNRPCYEEVLIVRVHPEILHNDGISDTPHDEKVWHILYRSIVDLEKGLHDNGTFRRL
jgi:polyphosphate kinase 2 (PPK2 family)